MPITSYDLGIVVGPQGLNINQRLEVGKRLKFIADSLEPGGRILLHAPRIHNQGLGIPMVHPDVMALQYKEKVVLAPMGWEPQRSAAEVMVARLRFCDEVWCCPGEGQERTMSRALTNQVYRLAQRNGCPDARVFKMIPVWAELPQGETKVKRVKRREPKLKKGKRK
jgi:hypothetical protein